MIFGKKSDVQKHLSSKHATFSHKIIVEEFSHKIIVEDAPPKAAAPTRDGQASAEQSPSSREEQPETNRFKS
jgi:hypothetical protein